MSVIHRCFESDDLRERIGFVSVFALAVFFAWLLSLAYPQGFLNEETESYWVIERGFHWFAPNTFDWARTIPYGAILAVSKNFTNPTNALYWLNALLFSFNSALVFILARSLFGSVWTALAVAIMELAFELVAMRAFYGNLQICADPFYAELIYLGVLLALIAWLRGKHIVLLSAYAIFGFASFVKPIGGAVIALWMPFIIWVVSQSSISRARKYATVLAALILSAAPLGLWAMRNSYIYGQFQSSGLAGNSLLRAVLPLVQDTDGLFDDYHKDAKFQFILRYCEKYNHTSLAEDLPADERLLRYEDYFICGPCAFNPFWVLAQQVDPSWRGERDASDHVLVPPLTHISSNLMFKLDKTAGQVAWRIIALHPLGYLRRVLREYIDLFNPLALPADPWDNYEADPNVAYSYFRPKMMEKRLTDRDLYPATNGLPDATKANRQVAAALGTLSQNPMSRYTLSSYYRLEGIIAHLIFLAAVMFCCYAGLRKKLPIHRDAWRLSVVLIMLFLTTFVQYLTIALTQVARVRYALAGDLELHLMVLMVVVFLATNLASRVLPR